MSEDLRHPDRGGPRRPLRTTVLALAAGSMLLLGCVGTGDGGEEELPVLWEAPDFTLVDRAGDTLHGRELRGTAWVAHFFFTRCEGVCPRTTARMRTLRDSLDDDGLLDGRVRLVSISVDPARDGPAALRAYADRFGGPPPGEWAFLTGSSPEEIRRLLEEGFKVTARPPEEAGPEEDYQVGHSPRLELVDPQGRVRATYDATEPGAIAQLRSDLRTVAP